VKENRWLIFSKKRVETYADDAVVFLVVTSILSFPAINMFKIITILGSLVYVLFNKKLKFSKNVIWLLGLFLVNFLVASYSLYPTDILKATFDRLALFMVATVIISSIYHSRYEIRKHHATKLAIMVIINIIFTLLMYIPKIISSESIFQYRINGYNFLSLVFLSANAIAFILFGTQVLLIYLYKEKGFFNTKINKEKSTKQSYTVSINIVFLIIQSVLTFFAWMTHSRGYYVYWILFLVLFLVLNEYRIRGLKSKVIWITIGLLGGFGLLYQVLQGNSAFIGWLNQLQQQTSPRFVLHRFVSLLKIVFSNNYVVDGATLERMNLLRQSWNVFVQNPLVGVGLGTFHQHIFGNLQNGIYVYSSLHSHAEFFEIISASGIVGGGLYYGSYIPLLKIKRTNLVLLSLLITILVSGFFFQKYYNFYFWWLLVTIMFIDQGDFYEVK